MSKATRSPSVKQLLASHLEHVLHVGDPLPARATLAQMQDWHNAAHERYLPHSHHQTGFADGRWARVVDIHLVPPKNPGAASRIDRNWTLQVNVQPHIVQYIPLGGTFAGDCEGAQKEANRILGYSPEWTPQGWGWRIKEDA